MQSERGEAGDIKISSDGNLKARFLINKKSFSTLATFGLIFLLLGLFGLVYVIDGSLPTPLYIIDEQLYPEAFITERARQDLKNITDVGPHIAGSYESEVLVADFLKLQIGNIIQNAHKNQKIELDVQETPGPRYWRSETYINSTFQNIIVKLHGAENADSLLINAHFDSAPSSPGASDDGISCAIIMEVLRKLSKEPSKPLNNIIFLFNGAEESRLQGSYAFMENHKWAKECKVVVNLDAAGAGGKMILFQTGPNAPWILDYYKKVPHPHAQVSAEEVYQSGYIPSGTDFSVFIQYEGVVGLDMAFYRNGHRYHTRFDDFGHIPLGSFQQAGDNILSLVRNLGNAPEISNPLQNPGKAIYFDYLGLFMITYSQTGGNVVNYTVALMSLAVFGFSLWILKSDVPGGVKQILKLALCSIGATVVRWGLAGLFIFVFTYITDKTNYSISWYRNSWLIFGLYSAPTVALSIIPLPFLRNKAINENVQSQINVHSVRIIFTILLIAGTVLNIRSMYPCMLLILFNSIAFILIYSFRIQNSETTWKTIYIICLTIPTLLLMYVSLMYLALFVPITGRLGLDDGVDFMIGMMSLFFTILVTASFMAIITSFTSIKYLGICLAVVFGLSVATIFTPLGFPYSCDKDSPAPDTYLILHTLRVQHNETSFETSRDSGYFVLNVSKKPSNRINSYVKELADSSSNYCQSYLLCGEPRIYPEFIFTSFPPIWVQAEEEPSFSQAVTLEVLSKNYLSATVLNYEVGVTGPNRMGIYLSPNDGIKLLKTSLFKKGNSRTVYQVLNIEEKTPARSLQFKFNFDVEISENTGNFTTEIAVFGIYEHDDLNNKTLGYMKFLDKFPEWADVSPWLASFTSWKI